uniref:Uncharacterized protein n=1 Tax=Glossina austeni TaxID=7395 RepID=A0A1A9VG71_GLOAU
MLLQQLVDQDKYYDIYTVNGNLLNRVRSNDSKKVGNKTVDNIGTGDNGAGGTDEMDTTRFLREVNVFRSVPTGPMDKNDATCRKKAGTINKKIREGRKGDRHVDNVSIDKKGISSCRFRFSETMTCKQFNQSCLRPKLQVTSMVIKTNDRAKSSKIQESEHK